MLLDLLLSTLFLFDIRFSEYYNSLCSDSAKVFIMSHDYLFPGIDENLYLQLF
jgi:hypothetical protein